MADAGIALSPEQRAAVRSDENRCLASCPGSGKTRVIVAKMLRCIEQVRDTTRRIACLTYTNAAVDEIEDRLRSRCTSVDRMYYEVSTIHAFCLSNILRPYSHLLPTFASGLQVVTADDAWYQDTVVSLASAYGIATWATEGFEQIRREANGTVVAPNGITQDAATEFLRRLDDAAKVTMGGIVYYGYALAARHRHISRGLASRFAWFLIDEFQDTTTSQVELLKEVYKHGRSRFFLVGDINQSIFGFAGAQPELMEELATHVGARTDISLVGNYRCSRPIVIVAERLCPCTPPMQAVGRNRASPIAPEHVHCSSALEGVWDYFLPRLDESHIALGEAAVLAPWWTSLYHLARDLRERDVPVVGPGSRPYKRSRDFAQFAEHACAYLEEPSPEIAASLQRALFIMLLRLNDCPNWSVYSYEGKKTLFRLLAQAKEVRLGHEGATDWLTETAARVATILVKDEFLSDTEAGRLTESAQAMVDDMIRNKVDIVNLRTEQLGLFARPKACLQLLTMHRAKGREFDAVAVVDCHEGKLPHFSATAVEEIDEARRLMYVVTRRARRLLMFFTDTSDLRNTPSRFLGVNELGIVRS